jgi:hypothetical protein
MILQLVAQDSSVSLSTNSFLDDERPEESSRTADLHASDPDELSLRMRDEEAIRLAPHVPGGKVVRVE